MPRLPTWQDWLQSTKVCERSMRFFESPKIAAINTLQRRIAKDNVLGHFRKGLAERALTDAKKFVAKIREVLEEGMGREFLYGI